MAMRRSVKFMRGLSLAAAVVAFSLMLIPVAKAMRLAPMVAEMSTSGSGATARIEVGNVGSRAMPFETAITRVEMDSEGRITETPGDDDFLVFPPQGLVAVNGQQVVRVQWVGPPLEQTRAYYLAVKQLPVETDPTAIPDTQSAISVNVLYTMKTLLLVSPRGVTPDVKVTSVSPTDVTSPQPEIDPALPVTELPTPTSTPGVKVEVTNQGGRHAMMSGATWIIEGTTVSGEAFSRRLSGTEVSQMVGVGYVPAGGGRRVFDLPLGVALDPAKPMTVRFTR
jgi:fimbrial chaperone protein